MVHLIKKNNIRERSPIFLNKDKLKIQTIPGQLRCRRSTGLRPVPAVSLRQPPLPYRALRLVLCRLWFGHRGHVLAGDIRTQQSREDDRREHHQAPRELAFSLVHGKRSPWSFHLKCWERGSSLRNQKPGCPGKGDSPES